MKITRRTFGRTVATLLVSAMASGAVLSSPAHADNWPNQPISFVVGFGVGGGADRFARAVAQFVAPELGVPVTVMNRPGAGGQLAASYVLSRPADGNTLLVSSLSPYLANSILHTNANYSLDDFAFVNGQWPDWDLIAARTDAGFSSLSELLTSIKENPGKHSAAVVQGSAGHLILYMILDAAGVPAENLNIVTYDNGGQCRAAVAGGQVDFFIIGGLGSDGVVDQIKPLAVMLDKRSDLFDAPTVNEALEPLGVTVPVVSRATLRGMAAPAAFRTQYPERWAKLVAAYERALKNPEFLAYLERNQIGADWIGPDETERQLKEFYTIAERYKDLMGK
ncbi:tripartite tricarboxylate transporter substrate binding protein [Telmatospirillum sp. J64-1]|uniref:Bug family tripartite tricarboxylate transporter substrate binding protein n=1 Tax=Telmatospirillum sp. J64-1 TaxID=2502183 RepID=UPI00115D9205|nr:tripartite tricarboxylate transporter substrate binding protein [Telmatospirillum sp. J64-1]